ncbi:FAD-dependent oxidoreductase [Enterovibrio norvegicus FF-33]|uniref:NAD(P)/FAD-dependent oxidoreductase n=1 Tax=Enterovibrio norvegicus TaxID=188144 RepID=UPI00031899D9|nr:FAD-dependent oxidoreductase [Enterovibrio norvegicus]OEE66915.1 FAD-dependent oxidoreductase [Enterovibrio norvegicus FF-33]
MKIAIIGSGISGLTCAHYLHKEHDITLFEANNYIGGHTATVDVEVASGKYAIDTGFIVFNDRTYPNFQNLMTDIGMGAQESEMSFSVRNDDNGLEYNGHSMGSLFAQKRNLLNPKFYKFISEILRFNKEAREAYTIATHGDPLIEQTLGDFLSRRDFSEYFCQNYILPMGAAIWSSTLSDMRAFPLKFFLRFFQNHGLLDVTNRPQWYVIPGGSREYVRKMVPAFEDRIKLNAGIKHVERFSDHVVVVTENGEYDFDQVIFACHSDQALALLQKPTKDEQRVLGSIDYQDNDVVLHTDISVLPRRKAAWASWNYSLGGRSGREERPAALSYNMNILQGIDAPETFCVTLNQSDNIDPSKILRKFVYAHPVFDQKCIEAQKHRELISGENLSWFCGAYWYNGFHEDGVRSALDVVNGVHALPVPLRSAS